ncbi:MAG: amidohydrolase [Clostridia bacterium]|nr:amidohydrolase [Clostridia bacterium]
MLIDFHSHAFPDALAERAIASLSQAGGISPYAKGKVADLIEIMDEDDVDISVVLNIATKPTQETNVNNFAISLLSNPRIVPFGSVYPGSETSISEVERLHAAGIKGIKFHPEYQWFDVMDERVFPTYEKCGELGMIVTFHAGGDVGFKAPFHSDPERLNKLCELFPKTTFVFAHMGGYDMWEEGADVYKYHDNMYLDTSIINTVSIINNDSAKRLIDNVGIDHILFGSDMPWARASHSRAKLEALGLSDKTLVKIYYENAMKLLSI